MQAARHERTVFGAALSTLSEKDMEFLQAMAVDVGPSVQGDIGRRIGAKALLVSNCRTRLAAAAIVESASYGKVALRHSWSSRISKIPPGLTGVA